MYCVHLWVLHTSTYFQSTVPIQLWRPRFRNCVKHVSGLMPHEGMSAVITSGMISWEIMHK